MFDLKETDKGCQITCDGEKLNSLSTDSYITTIDEINGIIALLKETLCSYMESNNQGMMAIGACNILDLLADKVTILDCSHKERKKERNIKTRSLVFYVWRQGIFFSKNF